MSIVCNASGEYVRRTASLPSDANYTMMALVYINSVRTGNYNYIFELGNNSTNSSNYHILGFKNTGAFELTSHGTSAAFSSAPGAGSWYHLYMRSNGTNVTAGYRAIGAVSYTTVSISFPAAFTEAGMFFGNDSWNEWADCRLAGIKVWDAHLTDAEIEREFAVLRPVKTANLHLWIPAVNTGSSRALDFSGNGKDLTEGGTLTDGDGPPVSWGAPAIIPQAVAAAGTTHTTTGALSAQAASVSGSSTHLTLHTTTGALSAQAAAVAGSATHLTLHTTTGALAADAATVSGAVVHPHTTTGALAADAATVAGSATRSDATGSHSTTGSLSAQDAAVTGSATHLTLHATTGALAADAATVAGTAAHLTLHTTTGALASGAATLAGAATNTPAALGAIARPDADTTAGAWLPSAGSDLFAMLDEETPDDSDYIRATTATTCEISLSEVADPGTSTGQAFSYRVWSPEGNGVIVRLKQGATTISTWTHDTLPTAATTYARNLTASECDAITDYAALSVEFESTV